MKAIRTYTFREFSARAAGWIERHIAVIYAAEIILVILLAVYGLVSENGFRARGY